MARENQEARIDATHVARPQKKNFKPKSEGRPPVATTSRPQFKKGDGKNGQRGAKYLCKKCKREHEAQNCPATCLKCGGLNHYARVCDNRHRQTGGNVQRGVNQGSGTQNKIKRVDVVRAIAEAILDRENPRTPADPNLPSISRGTIDYLVDGWENLQIKPREKNSYKKSELVLDGWVGQKRLEDELLQVDLVEEEDSMEVEADLREYTATLRIGGKHYVHFKLDPGLR